MLFDFDDEQRAMTRVSRDYGDTVKKETVFWLNSNKFSNYKIRIAEPKEEPELPSAKDIIARETAQLIEQQKRLSVRDLANKFEKGLAAAAKLSQEAKLKEAVSLEKHVLLKKLRDALESLRGRVAGRNKDHVDEAIAMVEALAVQLTQGEGELVQEKTEVKKLASILKQVEDEEGGYEAVIRECEGIAIYTCAGIVPAHIITLQDLQAVEQWRKLSVKERITYYLLYSDSQNAASEDAKRLVDEERSFARVEIESARAAVQRVEESLREQERISQSSGSQESRLFEEDDIEKNQGTPKVEELMREVQEARRIQMLHQPSKVMDMQLELGALRIQLQEKSKVSLQLQKELAMSKRLEENESRLFEFDGSETLGSYLRIAACTNKAPDLSKCSIQWYRVSSEGCKKELISEPKLLRTDDPNTVVNACKISVDIGRSSSRASVCIDGVSLEDHIRMAGKSWLRLSKVVQRQRMTILQFKDDCDGKKVDLREFDCSWKWQANKLRATGATKFIYAPEPFDVGRLLVADILSDNQTITVATTGSISQAPGLGTYVEALVRKPDTEFNVVVSQTNAHDNPSKFIHVFHVGKNRIKLCKGRITKAKGLYSSSMQLCGVRGDGNAAAQALFWQPKKGLSFVLAFESERERNIAIMLARRFAFDCNITLAGPGDRSSP
ncbi:hypothetical protein GIB67_023158 [Kingdonia uniflora]|uniref:Stomatal closure-related actin-binding protein 1 n=1 Tax=Kingdonia uniflora TaxID=39325 RepID=A0A7J7M5R1_9MAGN|nr:hypothetical protein GIB67_023158 [Kingdonia uniflora]